MHVYILYVCIFICALISFSFKSGLYIFCNIYLWNTVDKLNLRRVYFSVSAFVLCKPVR